MIRQFGFSKCGKQLLEKAGFTSLRKEIFGTFLTAEKVQVSVTSNEGTQTIVMISYQ